MEEVIYRSVVIGVGQLAPEFFREGIVVLFAEGAPPELEEISVVHRPGDLLADVVPGAVLWFGNQPVTITAVGEVVSRNLAGLGHAAIKFNGQAEPELPGDLCVEAVLVPPVESGMEIKITLRR